MKERIRAGTVAGTILLWLALLNQVLAMAGHSPLSIEEEAINTMVTAGWTAIAVILAWCKNNSFTQVALAGDAVKDRIKTGRPDRWNGV